jgi:hypothetical protein
MDGWGLQPCPVAGFGISGVEALDPVTAVCVCVCVCMCVCWLAVEVLWVDIFIYFVILILSFMQ